MLAKPSHNPHDRTRGLGRLLVRTLPLRALVLATLSVPPSVQAQGVVAPALPTPSGVALSPWSPPRSSQGSIQASTQASSQSSTQGLPSDASTISDEALRGLFIVERPPLAGFFGVLLTKDAWTRNPQVACWVRAHSPLTLTMADQEGGEVAHVPNVPVPPSPQRAQTMSPSSFEDQVQRAAEGLRDQCLDIDLAPVADLDDDGHPVRGYSADPQRAAPWAERFARTMARHHVTPVLKHYPGRTAHCALLNAGEFPGMRTNHEVERCAGSVQDVWTSADAFPVDSVNIVMLSNRIYPSVSPQPAVLDPQYVQRLRQRFHGLVITDALWALNTDPATIVQALQSADVVMLPSAMEVQAALPALRAAMASGRLPLAAVREKLQRATEVKARLLHERTVTSSDKPPSSKP